MVTTITAIGGLVGLVISIGLLAESLGDWTIYCHDMLTRSKVLNEAVCERPKYWPELYRLITEAR